MHMKVEGSQILLHIKGCFVAVFFLCYSVWLEDSNTNQVEGRVCVT